MSQGSADNAVAEELEGSAEESAAEGDEPFEPKLDRTTAAPQSKAPAKNWRLLLHPVLEWLVATVCSLLFALRFGFNYGVDNQVVYNLGAVHLLDRSLYKQDWFVSQTTNYHPTFEYFSAFLLWLNHDGWGFAITTTILITITGLMMFWLCRVLSQRYALASFLLLLALAFELELRSVMVSYVVDYILQPSTLGSVGFVGAMIAFINGRWTASGVLLGLGGLFHANYLVLGGVVFGLSQLMLGKDQLVRRGLRQLLVPSLALLIFVPTILKTAGGADVKAARDILFHIRSPHHFNASGYEQNFIPFIGWQLLGIGSGLGWLLGKDARGRRIGALLASMMITIWLGTAGATYFGSSFAAQLFVQRIAPHLELLLQALWAVTVVELTLRPARVREFSLGALALAVAGLGTLLMFASNHKIEGMPKLLLLGVYLIAGSQAIYWTGHVRFLAAKLEGTRVPFWVAFLGHALVVLYMLNSVVTTGRQEYARLEQHSTLLRGLDRQEGELYAWLREHTDKDSVLLTPPRVEGMRLHSQRAIVVDWKAVPIVPAEIVEWHKRLSEVSGHRVRGFRDIGGYDQLDQKRLDALTREYHLNYVVTFRGRERNLRGKRVYQNSRFVVLQL